jgi:hypothetical protein
VCAPDAWVTVTAFELPAGMVETRHA